jgi:hypothetical protein
MTKKRAPKKKPKVVWVGNTPITPITAEKSRELDRRIQKRKEGCASAIPKCTAEP